MRKALILAAALSLAAGGQALAHARLLHSQPANGSTVKAPHELRMSFSESPDLTKSKVELKGPVGPVATGPLSLDAKDKHIVLVTPSQPLKAGAYKVSWGMTTSDGHHTEGTFGFKVAP